jgi:hypothetical protein
MIWQPMQYRTSCDGLNWSAWLPLLRTDERLRPTPFVQVRVLVEGEWCVSPISSWELEQ